MGLAFLVSGIILVILGVRGNQSDFYDLLVSDITGGFVYLIVAIVAVGLVGQIPQFKTASTYFLVLILIVLLLKRQGAITNLEKIFHIGS